MPALLRNIFVAARAVLVLTIAFGVMWPLAMTGWAQVINNDGANGSIIKIDGKPVASSLIAQDFSGARWMHARPSAAGDGYDAMSSGGTNVAPSSEELAATVQQRRNAIAAEEQCDPADVPSDAVSASASGLDPQISAKYAALQLPRVARENGLSEQQVRTMIDEATTGGVISPKVVNVVEVNAAIAAKVPG